MQMNWAEIYVNFMFSITLQVSQKALDFIFILCIFLIKDDPTISNCPKVPIAQTSQFPFAWRSQLKKVPIAK